MKDMEEDHLHNREEEARKEKATARRETRERYGMLPLDTDLWEFSGECPECHSTLHWRSTGEFYKSRFTVESTLFTIACPKCHAAVPLLHFTIFGQATLIERLEG